MPEILDLAASFLIPVSDGLVFCYRSKDGNAAVERWSENIGHIVPNTNGIWILNLGTYIQVRHLFLASSGAELLCFCHLYSGWLVPAGQTAFASLGILPRSEQVRFLAELFPNARIHLLFDAGVTGRVTDCRIALWLAKRDAKFWYQDESIHVRYSCRSYFIPAQSFSLSRFEKTVGLRSGIRTHKPKEGANSFREYLSLTL